MLNDFIVSQREYWSLVSRVNTILGSALILLWPFAAVFDILLVILQRES